MNPKSGGRAVLDLVEQDERTVQYRAELYTPEATFRGAASIALEGGAVTFSPWTPGEPPEWLVKYAHTFLRSAWREHSRDASVPWPDRINRWREEKE
jgi:hypothetical protein